jgi:hypothetical protein
VTEQNRTAVRDGSEKVPSEVELIGQELAALCRMKAVLGDMPTRGYFDKWWPEIEGAIDEILDRDMATDPIEYAIGDLKDDGHIDGLEELAWGLLRRRDDYGDWSAFAR